MNLHILSFGDNYIYALEQNNQLCVVDPASAEPVLQLLSTTNLRLSLILNTHNHYDHTGGNQALKNQTECSIISGSQCTPGNNRVIKDNEVIACADISIQAIATPGHTSDSFCFYIPGTPGMVFTGDTLFVGGCGRLFGGTPDQLWNSLQRLAALPEDTLVYCGHEYAQDNYAFSAQLNSTHPAIRRRQLEMIKLIQAGQPTVPSTIGQEKQSNLFLLAMSVEEFAKLRKRKDEF
ncbi:hydroxyacylglutathione hydrolase [bacterium]|nr:hydroxyacylglutathione hydrolase [bacterium]